MNPWKIAKNLSEVSNKYMILMFPYKETLKIDEHMYHFSEQVIPMKINDFSLVYVNTIDGKDVYKRQTLCGISATRRWLLKKNTSSMILYA